MIFSLNRRFSANILRIFLLLSLLAVSSCGGKIGYGVLAWSVPDHDLHAGDVVPVFVQSNIGKVYVIGSKDSKDRLEVPLWQIQLYKSRSAARKAAQRDAEYRYSYALVKIDGLPIRSAPENTARQVYRLRAGQQIKLVRKGEGAPVMSGNSALPGDWYEVMTDDGSLGWCYSYNLTIIDEREYTGEQIVQTDSGPDPVLENLLSRAWYPDSWRTMIESSRIDLDKISPQWGFFPGRDSLVARIEDETGVRTFPYSSVVRGDDGDYRFEGSTLSVQVRRRNSILVQFTDENGMPQAHYFAALDSSPESLVSEERARRDSVLESIRSLSRAFSSGNYGVLQFPETGRFLWSGYQLLSPQIIPAGSGAGGSVENRVFIPASWSGDFDGVLSFKFDGSDSWIHFLYQLSSEGLKLEHVLSVKDALVQSRNLTPTVLFFSPANEVY